MVCCDSYYPEVTTLAFLKPHHTIIPRPLAFIVTLTFHALIILNDTPDLRVCAKVYAITFSRTLYQTLNSRVIIYQDFKKYSFRV